MEKTCTNIEHLLLLIDLIYKFGHMRTCFWMETTCRQATTISCLRRLSQVLVMGTKCCLENKLTHFTIRNSSCLSGSRRKKTGKMHHFILLTISNSQFQTHNLFQIKKTQKVRIKNMQVCACVSGASRCLADSFLTDIFEMLHPDCCCFGCRVGAI